MATAWKERGAGVAGPCSCLWVYILPGLMESRFQLLWIYNRLRWEAWTVHDASGTEVIGGAAQGKP